MDRVFLSGFYKIPDLLDFQFYVLYHHGNQTVNGGVIK